MGDGLFEGLKENLTNLWDNKYILVLIFNLLGIKSLNLQCLFSCSIFLIDWTDFTPSILTFYLGFRHKPHTWDQDWNWGSTMGGVFWSRYIIQVEKHVRLQSGQSLSPQSPWMDIWINCPYWLPWVTLSRAESCIFTNINLNILYLQKNKKGGKSKTLTNQKEI